MFSEDMIYKLAGSMLGISHEQARAHFAKLQQWNVDAIKGFDSRMRKLESDTAENAATLRAIALHLGIQNGTDSGQHAIIDGQLAIVESGLERNGTSG